MSNEVYGYIESKTALEWEKVFATIQNRTGIGIKLMLKSELYNFPEYLLPQNEIESIGFIIGDVPGKTNTNYLTDYQDYAPEAKIGFPVKAKDRLALLIDMLMFTIQETKAHRFVVAITDSSQIDEIKYVDLDEFPNLVVRDFEEYSSPDCVYDINRCCKERTSPEK